MDRYQGELFSLDRYGFVNTYNTPTPVALLLTVQ
jgi:hypothetical protein